MESVFENIKHRDEQGKEFWTARELARELGYSEYRHFANVLEKAKESTFAAGEKIDDHYEAFLGMVKIGSGANREVEDIRLTRYACLSIVECVDSRKKNIGEAKIYFSSKLKESYLVDNQSGSDMIFYTNPDGKLRVELSFDGETFWTTQKRMADIFEVDVRTISYHLQEIFASGELNKYSVIQKIRITADDGKPYETMFYNLDAIIAVGYRVNSVKATQFRIWATQVLSEYIRKGFVMDDERFKQGTEWSRNHFEEVLERIREIRSSERMLYQKITDIYATADDYMKDSITTRHFYAKVQNKLHWAITGQTAAEIIYSHVDATKMNMGLTTWKHAPDGKILPSDVIVAKNYLSEAHLKELNQIVSAYLDLAENRARRRITTTMEDWAKFLDSFLDLSSYPILLDKGKISAEQAKIKAYEEYNKFRVIQDNTYLSDFDKEVRRVENSEKNN